jgi:hypothetical protein
VLTFKLTVTSEGASSTDIVNVTIKNVNHAPSALAGDGQIVREGASVKLYGDVSFDPDGDPITFSWTQTLGPNVELDDASSATPTFVTPLLVGGVGDAVLLEFELVVSDGAMAASDRVQVRVEQENHVPIANAGPDQTKTEGSLVTLDGTSSQDPDGDAIATYTWTQLPSSPNGLVVNFENPGGPTPSFMAPLVGPGGATLTFELVVSDSVLSSEPRTVTVTVQNVNDPPLCGLARPKPSVLWPPDHKLIPIHIEGVTDPDNNQVMFAITAVTQDEPINGTGDADTSPDAVVHEGVAHLRAERASAGNGRVYRVAFTADDGRAVDGACQGAVTISVPSTMRTGLDAIDDGQLYDAIGP